MSVFQVYGATPATVTVNGKIALWWRTTLLHAVGARVTVYERSPGGGSRGEDWVRRDDLSDPDGSS